MEPGQIEALLGLDATRVAAVAGATEDYARLLSAGELEPLELDATAGVSDEAQHALCVASAFSTAASLWMLLDPYRAPPLLDVAAEQHDAAGTGHGDVLRICAHPRDAPVDQPFADRARPPEATLLSLLATLATGHTTPSEAEEAFSELTDVSARPRATPTGKLRLPLGLYIDMLFEVAELRSERVEQGTYFHAHATEAYLTRVAEITTLARADRHHWAMPGVGVLPVEPEAVAPCALVDVVTREVLGVGVTDVVGRAVDGIAGAPALVAWELVTAAEGLDEPGPPRASA